MSLQPCPACGKQYYEMADKCPNCSAPNSSFIYQTWKVGNDNLKAKDDYDIKYNPIRRISRIFGGK